VIGAYLLAKSLVQRRETLGFMKIGEGISGNAERGVRCQHIHRDRGIHVI
jgi:hypothetical protein